MKKTLQLIVLIITISINGQIIPEAGTPYELTTRYSNHFANNNLNISGTKYSLDNFEVGYINENKDSQVHFKFDAFNNQVELKPRNKKYSYFLKKKIGNTISFNNKLYKVYFNSYGKKSFYLLSKNYEKNKSKLLVKERKIINFPAFQYSGYRNDPVVISYSKLETIYYISFDDKVAKRIPKRKVAFYKLFEDKKELVSNFVKKNKLNRKKKSDITKIINFYDSLI